MSSGYSAAELEAIRRQRIIEELNRNIRTIQNQLREQHDNLVTRKRVSTEVINVVISDDVGDDTLKVASVSAQSLKSYTDTDKKRIELDLSDLLIIRPKLSKLEDELNSLIVKIDERIVVSEDDDNDRQRVLREVEKIANDASLDIEDKIKLVRMKVKSYLDSGIELDDRELEVLETEYYEYCALCGLLSLTAREHLPYKIKSEISRMRSVLQKRRETEYIMEVIEEIMEEMGCRVKEDVVLDRVLGTLFEIKEFPSCDIFIADDGSGIMFEPVGSGQEMSLEKRKQVEKGVKHACSLYSELEARAAERGVILKRVYLDNPNVDGMCVQSDITEHKKKHKKTNKSKKIMAINPED